MPPDNKRLLRYSEVKELLGVKDRDMEKLIAAGLLKQHHLPGQKRGRAYYFRSEVNALEQNWQQHETNGTKGKS